MIDTNRVESPEAVIAAGVMRGCQSALMAAEQKYYLAREAYERTVIEGGDGVTAMFDYDTAIREKATALEASAIARAAWKEARQEIAVRV